MDGLALTIWEAQYGDFVNNAQPIIDNFIVSGESKWNTRSSLVMLLPHGYEGQGPEHSSGHLARFLQLIDDDPETLKFPSEDGKLHGKQFSNEMPSRAEAKEAVLGAEAGLVNAADGDIYSDNMKTARIAIRHIAVLQESYDHLHNFSVVNLTTPANYFHALRRQVHRTFAKPLVVMSPKFLLQHEPCRSPLRHMDSGTNFQRVIWDGGLGDNMFASSSAENGKKVITEAGKAWQDWATAHQQGEDRKGPSRLIFCSGKVFYDLYDARAVRGIQTHVALVRLEQIAPFPFMDVVLCARRHPRAELIWVQEEPKNMGAWAYVEPRVATALRLLGEEPRPIRYVGRPPSASTATPLFKQHKAELRQILEAALAPPGDS
eukprot:gnl/TRDRNA2_/TRDRNA2_170190_c0_seq1.p1 gnl/TRDRNA2_/TRDRNA2_170190_c0~~gnl/TRDRNA2_/TRDRNA2_170190_c0_seq1.p1  ORF type:complete len:404 (+),score=47.69 gnl/TRDRNA2_/TRDRNA2_170190_c0_seq1:86-1213(+)